MQDEGLTFTMKQEDGRNVVYEILFFYESGREGMDYVIYTDNTFDEKGYSKIYASICTSDIKLGADCELLPIESDREWRLIQRMLDKMAEETDMEEEEDEL